MPLLSPVENCALQEQKRCSSRALKKKKKKNPFFISVSEAYSMLIGINTWIEVQAAEESQS